MSYVEKLESNFNQDFLEMQVNQESKKYNQVSYVKMLEQMCRDRKIEVQREPFPTSDFVIFAKDQTDTEKRWVVEEETDIAYKIYHYDMVTMISKDKVYIDVDGKLRYEGSLYVPEDVNRFSLDFYSDMFIDNMDGI